MSIRLIEELSLFGKVHNAFEDLVLGSCMALCLHFLKGYSATVQVHSKLAIGCYDSEGMESLLHNSGPLNNLYSASTALCFTPPQDTPFFLRGGGLKEATLQPPSVL